MKKNIQNTKKKKRRNPLVVLLSLICIGVAVFLCFQLIMLNMLPLILEVAAIVIIIVLSLILCLFYNFIAKRPISRFLSAFLILALTVVYGAGNYYIFKTNADSIHGTIMVNENNVLSNEEIFLGTLREGEEYFDASLTTENIVLLISKDTESFIMLFQNPENDIFDTGKNGTMMLIYPATSKKQALERLWEALPKSITLQRRLLELDWK